MYVTTVGHNSWLKYLPLSLLLTWTPLIFCYSTHITLISLCMAVLPSLRPPWLCLTFISSQIRDTTAAESGGFHTSILWASAWWALFTINKRIKPHWVWVQCSHSVRWEGRTASISLFSSVPFLEAVQFSVRAKNSGLFFLFVLEYQDVCDCFIYDRFLVVLMEAG